MSSTGKIRRDMLEIIHDEMIMKDRIAKILRGQNWDMDVAYSLYHVPEGETRKGGTVMFSFGLRI